MPHIFKIVARPVFDAIGRQAVFAGAGIDLVDGYIHFSTAQQVRETARLRFAGQEDLVLFAVDAAVVHDRLKWEASRGGQLFPHVHGVIRPTEISWHRALPWNGTTHDFPPETFL
jgi:uncharacterized protein (DUF952 family)